jgi:uncharacterized membrane protein
MKEQFTAFVVACIYIAILYTLVRPGSKGTVLVNTIGTTLSDLVRGVTGQTFNSKTGWSTSNGLSANSPLIGET